MACTHNLIAWLVEHADFAERDGCPDEAARLREAADAIREAREAACVFYALIARQSGACDVGVGAESASKRWPWLVAAQDSASRLDCHSPSDK